MNITVEKDGYGYYVALEVNGKIFTNDDIDFILSNSENYSDERYRNIVSWCNGFIDDSGVSEFTEYYFETKQDAVKARNILEHMMLS